jgi:hypothetical protein
MDEKSEIPFQNEGRNFPLYGKGLHTLTSPPHPREEPSSVE